MSDTGLYRPRIEIMVAEAKGQGLDSVGVFFYWASQYMQMRQWRLSIYTLITRCSISIQCNFYFRVFFFST